MRKSAGILTSLVLSAVAWVACTSGDSTSPSAESAPLTPLASIGTEKCSDFGTFSVKDEVGPPWSITAPAGQVVTTVCVKAGTQAYVTNSNGIIFVGSTPCFQVQGLGTATVLVTLANGFVGNICKGISHIEAGFGPAPTPTPTPSPSPSSSPA